MSTLIVTAPGSKRNDYFVSGYVSYIKWINTGNTLAKCPTVSLYLYYEEELYTTIVENMPNIGELDRCCDTLPNRTSATEPNQRARSASFRVPQPAKLFLPPTSPVPDAV